MYLHLCLVYNLYPSSVLRWVLGSPLPPSNQILSPSFYECVCVPFVESPTTTQLLSSVPTAQPTVEKTTVRTPTKRSRRPQRGAARAAPSASDRSFPLPPRSFAIGELIWGPARGHPAWPGKIVKMPDGVCTPSQQFDHVWVQWFGGGGRSTSELIPVNSLQSLSEGLEAHHKAQKDTRK